jgi:hypothetical protein
MQNRYLAGFPQRQDFLRVWIWRSVRSNRHGLQLFGCRPLSSVSRASKRGLQCCGCRRREHHLKPRRACRELIPSPHENDLLYQMYLGLDRAHFLSATGQCKAWDASADGYSRSEGCGMFVLKRLSDAQRENDNILGVIRGVEVNQSGQAHSITHPHEGAQVALFRRLVENSGIDPSQISVVEAHGTGE